MPLWESVLYKLDNTCNTRYYDMIRLDISDLLILIITTIHHHLEGLILYSLGSLDPSIVLVGLEMILN